MDNQNEQIKTAKGLVKWFAVDKNEQIKTAKGLARWFAVDITIKLFGVTIWQYHFPPKKTDKKTD